MKTNRSFLLASSYAFFVKIAVQNLANYKILYPQNSICGLMIFMWICFIIFYFVGCYLFSALHSRCVQVHFHQLGRLPHSPGQVLQAAGHAPTGPSHPAHEGAASVGCLPEEAEGPLGGVEGQEDCAGSAGGFYHLVSVYCGLSGKYLL